MLTAASLFDLERFSHAALFSADEPVWSALRDLPAYMDGAGCSGVLPAAATRGIPLAEPLVIYDNRLIASSACTITYGDTTKGGLVVSVDGTRLEGASLIMAGAILIGAEISIGSGCLIEGGATIKAPAIIGDHSEVRQGAYMRGYCLVGTRCVVGHATEVKHSIFLDDAKAGHFAYLGDSILGNHVNLGAGTKFANLRFMPGTITILYQSEPLDTGRRKFGAILGDHTQTGCNTVTNPGTIIGKSSVLMPNSTAPPGYHPNNSVIR